jgi:ferredoxin
MDMYSVDADKCTGCGLCVQFCPQGAIIIQAKVAVIDYRLCSKCGICAETCPAGAIRTTEPVYAKSVKGGERMYYRYGFGFRGASPPWPYVGRGRGGLPRCSYPGITAAFPYTLGPVSYFPGMAREQELGFLKEEADVARRHLEDLEARIKELETKQE